MLINGIHEDKNIEYHYCYVSREIDYICSKEGKIYKKEFEMIKYIKKLMVKYFLKIYFIKKKYLFNKK